MRITFLLDIYNLTNFLFNFKRELQKRNETIRWGGSWIALIFQNTRSFSCAILQKTCLVAKISEIKAFNPRREMNHRKTLKLSSFVQVRMPRMIVVFESWVLEAYIHF
jgi:hypothetical protein